MRRILIAAAAILALGAAPAHAAYSDYGLQSVSASLSDLRAGAHPDFGVDFALKTDPSSPLGESGLHAPYAFSRDIAVGLPPGLIGNPHAVAQCSAQDFATALEETPGAGCPQDSQIGIAKVQIYESETAFTEPVFNLVPPPGAPARLGLYGGVFKTFLEVEVRSDGDYGLNSVAEELPTFARLIGVETTIWGVPASHAHDTERLTVLEAVSGATHSPPRESGLAQVRPFLQNPTRCGVPQEVFVETDSYQEPGRFDRRAATLPALSGCGALAFQPHFTATPTTHRAASPSGIDVELSQAQDETLEGRATAQLRDARVAFPPGMTLAAGAAEGLAACSAAQVGYEVSPPPPSDCPAASKIGTAEFDVPQLPRTIEGALYQRTPGPPGDRFRVWLVSDELGVHVKIPGDIQLDPSSGQVTSLFLDNPQVPLADLKLHVFGGERGPFATPSSCGTYRTAYEFTPWSGTPAVSGTAPMSIDSGCGTGGFAPSLQAGPANPTAGAFSPFVLRLDLAAGEQNLSGLELTLPEGVLAKLKGVPLCPDAAAVTGACPAGSQVGSAKVASGPGPAPLWLPQPGREAISIYLAGPYEGAPYSLVVNAPAQAGPFDLGTVVVRQALYVDPLTGQVTVRSDPLPQFLEGVPVTYRTIYATIDRPDFTINPTSCEPAAVRASLSSPSGATADPSSPFQLGSCASLGFKPRLALRLKGATRRGRFPALRAVFRPRQGDANAKRLVVRLPHSAFLEQGHIRTICTRVQYAAGAGHGSQCPKGSVYGHVRAFTPILDEPLEGPVFLRSSSHNLPDMVLSLHGAVDIEAVGRIDSVKGGIRSSFEAVPDAPLSKVVLNMQGGKKGLIVNSRSLCFKPKRNRARAVYGAHNGRRASGKPLLRATGCSKGRKKRHKRHRRAG